MVQAAIPISSAILDRRHFGAGADPVHVVRGVAPQSIPTDSIRPNPHQPRRTFNEEALKRLADSLQRHGTLQPILIRPVDDGYELVAGERRLRAARLAGFKEIPAIVKHVRDDQMLVLALIENLHRENLPALDKAYGYQALCEEHGMSHAQIAGRMNVNPRTVSNTLRLFELGKDAFGLLESGELGIGHGKALLGLRDERRQSELARRAADEGWSVRRVENEVRKQAGNPNGRLPVESTAGRVKALLKSVLNLTATTRMKRGGGAALEIDFDDLEAIERLAAKLEGV